MSSPAQRLSGLDLPVLVCMLVAVALWLTLLFVVLVVDEKPEPTAECPPGSTIVYLRHGKSTYVYCTEPRNLITPRWVT